MSEGLLSVKFALACFSIISTLPFEKYQKTGFEDKESCAAWTYTRVALSGWNEEVFNI